MHSSPWQPNASVGTSTRRSTKRNAMRHEDAVAPIAGAAGIDWARHGASPIAGCEFLIRSLRIGKYARSESLETNSSCTQEINCRGLRGVAVRSHRLRSGHGDSVPSRLSPLPTSADASPPWMARLDHRAAEDYRSTYQSHGTWSERIGGFPSGDPSMP